MNRRVLLPLLMTLSASLAAPPACASEGVVLPLETRGWFGSARHHVRVPAELNQIVLERQEGAAWRPVRTWHLTAPARLPQRPVAISMPRGLAPANARVVAYRNDKFPAGFTRGRRSFPPRSVSSDSAAPLLSGLAGTTLMRDAEAAATLSATTVQGQAESVRIVEPDIWHMAGDTLFFFNQYRGLQVLDMEAPASPRRTGALRLPASGEQMFVLDEAGSELALLGRSSRRESAGEAALFVVSVRDGAPSLEAELPIGGFVVDSRLVGRTLHVLTQSWHHEEIPPGDDGDEPVFAMPLIRHSWGRWVSEARLHSFDLTSLDTASALPVVALPGQARCLQAASGHLLVGAQDAQSWTPRLHILTTQPGAAPVLLKTVQPAGYIQDKFKVSIVNDAVCAVSTTWRNAGFAAQDWQRENWVETFPLAGNDTAPLARLELLGARDESLHATRFDGSRLYVVTFLQVDPLFVVDLANPAAPQLHGVLEIPGWSTYLEPMGDRLLAVGVEDGRVTASLFDVADPGAPAMLSRLSLGQPGLPSWSEAHYDEKAVHYDPVANLLLVPYEQWTSSGHASAVQVISVNRDALAPVQNLPHANRARRGSLHADHYITISGQELQATPRDGGEPARLTLAWTVDRVLARNGFLIQVDDGPRSWGWGWRSSPAASMAPGGGVRGIIISAENDPDTILAEIEIEDAPVIGMKAAGDRLFLAQWLDSDSGGRIRTWVLDLTQLPDLPPLATLEQAVDTHAWALDFDNAQALLPRADLLVWHLPARTWGYRWWWPRILQINSADSTGAVFMPGLSTAAGAIDPAARADSAFLPFQPAGRADSCAGIFCPVILGPQPEAGEPVMLNAENLHQTGRTLAGGGFIYVSHDESLDAAPSFSERPATMKRAPAAHGKIRVSSWLHVLDCRSSKILARQPVRLPGRLLSLHLADAQGAILLTDCERSDGPQSRHVQAAAYDGLKIWQLHDLKLDLPAWTPEATDGARLFFAQKPEIPGVLGIAYEENSGRLIQAGAWSTAFAPAALHVTSGLLLASSHGNLEIAAITEEGLQPHLEGYETPVNLWPRLERAHAGTQGLWLPVREYGVEFLPWQPSSP